jgi:hypothetical protein
MRSRYLSYVVAASLLLVQTAPPAFAQRRGATGPRGGSVQHSGGPRRGATTATGPRGGTAARAYGPRGSVSGARGAYGGGAAHATGRYGQSAGAVRGPYGGTAARANGPYGSRAVARGPYGGAAYSRNSYVGGGRQYYRPAWNANRINVYGRPFVGYPGWRAYGTYGLTPGLAAYTGLAFLSAGLLIGSYAEQSRTVYVYVVNEGGQNVEYRVDSAGNVISKSVVN